MPPKRQSTEGAGSAAKKAKTVDPSDPPPEQALIRKPEAYDYICLCKPFHRWGSDGDDEEDEEDDEDEDEDEDDAEKEKEAPCDIGKTCVCFKPAAEHPEHPWVITNAATWKLRTLNIMISMRDPDAFGMYTYNDHFGYGILEMLQNLILDFEEAKTWKEQWAICEGTALFFARGNADPLWMVDDGEGVEAVISLIGTMFVTTLAMLDREGLLKPDSEAKSLGAVMAAFIRVIAEVGPDYGIEAGSLNAKVLAYAKKHNIELKGLSDIADTDNYKKYKEDADKLELPASDDQKGDPWGWKKALTQYKKLYGPKIGGDKLDISTWTSAERKKAAFDKKDPFDKQMIAAIKDGMIMQPA
ncbi:hypothetical protein N7494_009100 [Penicillium frequentans]|uniref:Uncharacterized protein n=1 Tax=Penicillium frequentans TaxID=3151616 RepID=A0AAD6GD28_9EURO|nr:hypothetical protein N7494_009100 [Penicillium glabrum]